MTDTTEHTEHQAGTMQAAGKSEAEKQEERANRLLRLTEQLVRAGGTIDKGLRDMLAEVTAMEAAYLFADQMSWSETVLPEYRRTHRPSKGRGNNKTYGAELGRQAAINGAAAIMYGRALGIGMTQSLQVIHNINGKSGLDARTMQALCETHGDVTFEFDPANDDQSATVSATRPGHKPVTSTWTMAHAEHRDYTKNPLYNSHPDEMLRSKALAECCRLIAPDVVLGLAFTYEELQLDADTTVEIVAERGAGGGGAGTSAPTTGRGGMAGLGAHLAGRANGATIEGEVVTTPEPPQTSGSGDLGDDADGDAEGYDGGWAEAEADREVVDEAQAVVDAHDAARAESLQRHPSAQADEPEPDARQEHPAPDAKGLTALHTALTEGGFKHRSQKLGIVGALVGRTIESTNDLTNDELGRINHQLRQWIKAGTLADECRKLLTTVAAPAPQDDGPTRATTKELQELRRAYKEHLQITGADMLPHLSQTLGWDVTDINALTGDDVYEAIKVAKGEADRG